MNSCHDIILKNIYSGIKYYRTVPKYKHVVDNLQWSLKCCGLKSYKDWFDLEWHDKIRDYEWDSVNKRDVHGRKVSSKSETDSVPFSCCKSGSCISNYLKELGTYSINTAGCGDFMYRIVMISMNAHLILFLSIIIIEALLLKFICINTNKAYSGVCCGNKRVSVRHLMPVNDDFDASSGSYMYCQEEGDGGETYTKFDNDN
ncbi:uncharacterized protein Tsp33B isoform X2 [Epargyreus clarus]